MSEGACHLQHMVAYVSTTRVLDKMAAAGICFFGELERICEQFSLRCGISCGGFNTDSNRGTFVDLADCQKASET